MVTVHCCLRASAKGVSEEHVARLPAAAVRYALRKMSNAEAAAERKRKRQAKLEGEDGAKVAPAAAPVAAEGDGACKTGKRVKV